MKRWLASLPLVVAIGGCTTYQPLDHGSPVPWAGARVAAPLPSPLKPALAPETTLASVSTRRIPSAGEIARTPLLSNGAGDTGETPSGRGGPLVLTGVRAADAHREAAGGEAPAGITRRYAVPVAELADENEPAASRVVPAGQSLGPAGPGPRYYTVQRGDSLSEIAERFAISTRRLAHANGLGSADFVREGQRLRLPERTTTVQVASSDPRSGVAGGGDFLWPVEGRIIARFGETWDGIQRDGLAVAARKGTPIRAAREGAVVYAGDAVRGLGRMVLLRHDDGYVTTYAHTSALLVNVGDKVAKGQVIARVGSTGKADRPMLHFEVRKGRTPIDPETVLQSRPTG